MSYGNMFFHVIVFSLFSFSAAEFKTEMQPKAMDIGHCVSESQIRCLWNYNYRLIIRAYSAFNGGGVDYNACNTYKKSLFVDPETYPTIYMEPAPDSYKSAREQFNELYQALNNPMCGLNNVKFMYIQVAKSHLQRWSFNIEENVNFIRDIIRAAEEKGFRVGIYTNEENWSEITGDCDHKDFNPKYPMPLWYTFIAKSVEDIINKPETFGFGGWNEEDIGPYQYTSYEDICHVLGKVNFLKKIVY